MGYASKESPTPNSGHGSSCQIDDSSWASTLKTPYNFLKFSATGTVGNMTHDELLAKVNALDYLLGTEPSGDKAVAALRAVLELHRPDMRGNCDICSWIIGKPGYVLYSVCPTIRAIEEILG